MADVLVRGIPDALLARLDSHAKALGLSRAEYIRRTLERDAQASSVEVTLADYLAFAATFEDLKNDDVMEQAWR